MNSGEVITAHTELADLTLRGRIGVEKVDARSKSLHVVCEILFAGLASWSVEDGEFLLGTDDLFVEDGEGEETAHEVGKLCGVSCLL